MVSAFFMRNIAQSYFSIVTGLLPKLHIIVNPNSGLIPVNQWASNYLRKYPLHFGKGINLLLNLEKNLTHDYYRKRNRKITIGRNGF